MPSPKQDFSQDRIPDWVDAYYPPKFRDVGRRDPERRRVITVTPSAAAKLWGVATGMSEWHVRVRVEVFRDGGGTPTELQDHIELDVTAYPEFDLVDDSQGVPVVVDRRSAEYLGGRVLDWVGGDDGHPILK